jgi:uncharacterized membrane protein YvbJ
MIHCWKCGKMSTLGANFCMVCGSSIFEVGTEPKIADVQMPSNSKNKTKSIGLKIPIMIGIPVLILIILGGAYNQGFFDNSLEIEVSNEPIEKEIEPKDSVDKAISPTETNSKCGPGTVFDSKTNSCVLDK